jgi:coenzyme PQQ precursor peptide PqqA
MMVTDRPPAIRSPFTHHKRSLTMQWIDPAFCDIRLGFEVTAYVYVR